MTAPAPPGTDLLLIEPDPAEAELAVRCLRSRVTVARDAAEALRSLETRAPRLVLLNPKLPGSDGMHLLEQLRSDPRFRATPVVILLSDDRSSEVTRALSLGANSVVMKPVRFEALRAALTEVETYWLRRHAAG